MVVILKVNYTRNDFLILSIILKNSCMSEMKSMTIKEIQENTKLSYAKIRITLNNFLQDGFINEGIKKVNAKAFYISEKGMDRLLQISGEDNTGGMKDE